MKQRSLLKSQLCEAWKFCISEDYRSQRINSERGLQASYWSHLNQLLDAKNRRVFIEPSIKIEAGNVTKIITPDIVICNTRQVIGVVELKYLPRAKPKYSKDIESLAAVARYRDGISISNIRFRGTNSDIKEYSFSKEPLIKYMILLAYRLVRDQGMP